MLADFFAAPTINVTSQKIEAALLAKADSAELEALLDQLETLDEEQAGNQLAQGKGQVELI